ncbi:phage holin family protein [Candidatus Saccharibacteria bacterium]|jgi:putative membrane protein|nr:phage holin family protein [Candidatus Saccharibacteria bacterium]
MKRQFYKFLIRWLVNSLGLFGAAQLFKLIDYQDRVLVIAIGGLILSLLNAVIKPVFILFTLPAIALTLGLFMVIINGTLVYLASVIYKPLAITSFWAAVLVGMFIGLVNYVITLIAEKIEVKASAEYF